MSDTINKLKLVRRTQRKSRVSGAVRGSTERPRLSIFRSVKHIYAQIIDDTTGKTLVSVNSDQKDTALKHGGNKAAAAVVGKAIAGKAIAASAGLDGRVTTHAVTRDGFGLPEHWDQGDARRAIRRGGWTHVVLQQGPSSLPESRVVLRDYAKRFAAESRAAGAAVVFYGVWPPRSRLSFLDAVTGSYAAAAADVTLLRGASSRS